MCNRQNMCPPLWMFSLVALLPNRAPQSCPRCQSVVYVCVSFWLKVSSVFKARHSDTCFYWFSQSWCVMLPPGSKPGTEERPHVERRMSLWANLDSQWIRTNRFWEAMLPSLWVRFLIKVLKACVLCIEILCGLSQNQEYRPLIIHQNHNAW